MKPDEYYRKLAASITDADVRKVANLMHNRIGESRAIGKRELEDYSGFSERKIRDILEILATQYGWGVGGYSGKSGYWIIETEDERSKIVAELMSRADKLRTRANAIRGARLAPPAPALEAMTQEALFISEPEPVGYWQQRWESR